MAVPNFDFGLEGGAAVGEADTEEVGALVHGEGELAADEIREFLLAGLTHGFKRQFPFGWLADFLALRGFVGGHEVPRCLEGDWPPSYS